MNSEQPLDTPSLYYQYDQPKPLLKRLFASNQVWSPYCPHCQKWLKVDERIIGIPVAENVLVEKTEAEIVQRLKSQQWTCLKTAEPLSHPATQPAVMVSLSHCESCSGPFALRTEIHGKSGKILHFGCLFSLEIPRNSALELLEVTLQRNLAVGLTMDARARVLSIALGTGLDFPEILEQRKTKQRARNLGVQAMATLDKGKPKEAEELLRQALVLFSEIGELKAQGITYLNLANLHYVRRDYAQVTAFLNQALKYYDVLHDITQIATIYGFLGTIQFQQEEYEAAKALFEKALALDEQAHNKKGVAIAYQNLANANKHLRLRPEALAQYQIAQRLWRELGEREAASYMQEEIDRMTRKRQFS